MDTDVKIDSNRTVHLNTVPEQLLPYWEYRTCAGLLQIGHQAVAAASHQQRWVHAVLRLHAGNCE